jgi:hypothetical protein
MGGENGAIRISKGGGSNWSKLHHRSNLLIYNQLKNVIAV